ncbi:MAG: hypothetical protein H8D23_17760, partial [Candidatus Brocadiales bacterium]|nr:hypothetical protein [Candidatus Brocadiales bacterium]
PTAEAVRNVEFMQGNKKEQAKVDKLSPEERDLAKKKASIEAPAVGDVTTGTNPELQSIPKPERPSKKIDKITTDREEMVFQERDAELDRAKRKQEILNNPDLVVYPKEAQPEEIIYLQREDDLMSYRWSSIVWNKFGNLSAVQKEDLLQGLADRYESMNEEQFKTALDNFKSDQVKFSEIEKQSAVTYFENHPRMKAIEFDANGNPFINEKKFVRNAMVHRIYDVKNNPNRVLYMDKQTEVALRAKIAEEELSTLDMVSLQDMVSMAGMEEVFKKPVEEGGFNINLEEYHDFMQPSGKYSRFLLKYPKEILRKAEDGSILRPTEKDINAFHDTQMRLMMGDAYLDAMYDKGQHNKANKYFGQ